MIASKRAIPSIQCSTGPFWAFELERALDAVAEAGFTSVELMVTRDPQTHDPDIPGKLAAERDLQIESVHGPFLVFTRSVWGLEPVAKVRRGVQMCRALGAGTLIVHPPYLWEREYARWLTHEAQALCSESGVEVAVETMYPKWVAGRRLRAYRWLEPRALRHFAPHSVLDTSHLAVGRYDILEAYRVLAPTLVHIHLSDNAGDGRDGHLGLEQGILPIDRLLDELRSAGYAGGLSLELSVSRYIERPTDLVGMLRRNREFVEDRLTRGRRVTKGLPR